MEIEPVDGNVNNWLDWFGKFKFMIYQTPMTAEMKLQIAVEKMPFSDELRWRQFVLNRNPLTPNTLHFNDWFRNLSRANQQMKPMQDEPDKKLNSIRIDAERSSASRSKPLTRIDLQFKDGSHALREKVSEENTSVTRV